MEFSVIIYIKDVFMKFSKFFLNLQYLQRSSCLAVILLAVLLSACSQNSMLYHDAKREKKAGEYEKAYFHVVESLIMKPSNAKAQELLKEVYPMALGNREDNLRRILASNDGDRFDRAVVEYTALEKMNIAAKKLPTLRHPKTQIPLRITIPDYSQELNQAKLNAAEYHYQKGIQFGMIANDPQMQRDAAKEFKLALGFVDDYKDAQMYYQESRQRGVRRLAILPFENHYGQSGRYVGIESMFADLIISGIHRDQDSMEFLEIITRDKINTIIHEQELLVSGLFDESSVTNVGSLLGAHEILTGKISQILYSPLKTNRIRNVETKSIKTGEEEYENSVGEMKTRDVFDDVSCEYYTLTKSSKIVLAGSYSIIDVATGKIQKQYSLYEEVPFSASWTIQGEGDARALSNETLAKIKRGEPASVSEHELLNTAINRLATGIVGELKNYLK